MVLARLADRIDIYRPKSIYVDGYDWRQKKGGRAGGVRAATCPTEMGAKKGGY